METKTFKQLETEAARDAAALKLRGASLPASYAPGTTAAAHEGAGRGSRAGSRPGGVRPIPR